MKYKIKKVLSKAIIFVFAAIIVFTSYGNAKEPPHDPVPGKIFLTTSGSSRSVEFVLNERNNSSGVVNGTVSIDWGDGTPVETLNFSEKGLELSYEYSDTTARRITITSTHLTSLSFSCERHLTSLNVCEAPGLVYLTVPDNQLTELDVSKNSVLQVLLVCNNNLSNLDVTQNTSLYYLSISKNQFDAEAINALFRRLHDKVGMSNFFIFTPDASAPVSKLLSVGGNPGHPYCDKSIADNKGWGFIEFP